MSTVLLTSVGGLSQVSVIKHLRTLPEVTKIIGYDAGGYYGAAKGFLDSTEKFLLSPPRYADVVLPCGDNDAIWLNHELAWIINKPVLLQVLAEHGIAVPRFVTGNLVEKPVQGSGGRGQRVFDSFVMEYVLGEDWSVDVLVNNGVVHAQVPRARLRAKGASIHGRVKDPAPEIRAIVRKTIAALGPVSGLLNVQLFTRARDGVLMVYEVNPRISGSIMLSVYAGVDLLRMEIRRQLGLDFSDLNTVPRDGATMHRYYSEAFSG